MEELISALELAIARVDELIDKEECGFVHNRLERSSAKINKITNL